MILSSKNLNQIWFLHPTIWASIKSGQCVRARVFSSFVSTVFTKSVASSFVATQVISHQQKVEVTTVTPYASESVTIESSIHTTCFKLQDNQFFFLVLTQFFPQYSWWDTHWSSIDDLSPYNPIPNNLLINHFHFLVPAIKDITKCTWPLFGSVIIRCHTHKMPFTSAVGLYNWETKRSGPTHRLIFWSNYLQKFIIQQFRFIYLFVIAHTLCILNPWSHPPPNLVGKGNSIWARVH